MKSVAPSPKPKPNPFDGQEQIVFYDPKKDIYKAKIVLGPAPPDFYRKKLVEGIVSQVLKQITPDYEEKDGYEIVSYSLLIKKHKSS